MIIIGAGMAGLTAGIYVARAGKSVLVLESSVTGGQIVNTLVVDNWPGMPGVSGSELMKKIRSQVEELGAVIKYEEIVKVAEDDGSFKVTTDESKYECGAVIIATGTEPRKLSEAQEKDAGERAISYCATCDGALFRGKPVVVVGSGNTAKNEIAYLENIASSVYHIHHDEPIPEDAVAVFVAIGRIPKTKFLQGFVELDPEGYVKAGEDCKTNVSGVFVAGDCRTKGVRQLVTAASDGAVAALAAVKYLG